MAKEIIKIRLKAYDHRLIDQSAKKIIDSVLKTGAKVHGPIPLPTEKEIFFSSTFTSRKQRFT